jgi:hypothetical protein
LPPEKVFPIQIGSELFRLSGASISSDGLGMATMEEELVLILAKLHRTLHSFLRDKSDRTKNLAV